MKILRLLFVLLCFLPACAQAQEGSQFLSSISDIPLMPGLVELPDHTLSFDKPEGRIIETLVLIEGIPVESVQSYYDQTLPQFGWQPAGEGVFIRGEERLQLSYDAFDEQNILKVMIMPREGA